MGEEAGYCSSSSEEDGDAEWKAAINSVATDFITSSVTNGSAPKKSNRLTEEDEELHQKPKLYQIKVQKLLEEMLDSSLMMVTDDPVAALDDDPPVNEVEGGVRLFRHAPPGIIFDAVDELQQQRKRPKILPGEEVDEKSKKFKRQLKSVAVDGIAIMAAARDSCQKSLARYEAKNAAAKEKAKKEEERVAELKKIRGEKWLPSIAREMGVANKQKILPHSRSAG